MKNTTIQAKTIQYNAIPTHNKTPQKVLTLKSENRDIAEISAYNRDIKPTDPEWVTETMPKYCFGAIDRGFQEPVWKIAENIQQSLRDFYAGNATEEDIIATVQAAADAVFAYNVSKHRTTADDEETKAKVLQDTWEEFRCQTVRVAKESSYNEGKAIADTMGDPISRQWLYYNADYHYKSESIMKTVHSYMVDVAEEKQYDIDFRTSFADKPDFYAVFESYNVAWSNQAAGQVGNGKMFDPSIAPPEGFKFFFKENIYTEQERENMVKEAQNANPQYHFQARPTEAKWFDGYLRIESGEYITEGHVPFRHEPNDKYGFNMYSLAKSFGDMPKDENVLKFMKNFDFHLRAYSGAYRQLHG